jgi:hypothetical protein
MRLHPKVIPAISREAIQLLMQDGDIEVEPVRIADAEMDLSAIMREYLTNEERVNQATREALERRGLDDGKFNQVKREMADVRGFKMGDEGIESVIEQMIEFLLISRNVEEVFAADDLLRTKVLSVMTKHLRESPSPGPSGGGNAPPPSFQGEPPGGLPAEARVSEEPPRRDLPEDDHDRREAHTGREATSSESSPWHPQGPKAPFEE